MQNPYLLAALGEDRHRQCPCGAIAERHERLCRKCRARMAWRRKTTRASRRAARHLVARQVGEGTQILASVMALFGAIGKGVES
jgi:hypothetical protein